MSGKASCRSNSRSSTRSRRSPAVASVRQGDETDFARQPDIARQRVSADGNDWRADELRIVAYQPERFSQGLLPES
jgi:hypothetical protein